MTLLPGFRSRPGGLGAGLLAILLWLFVAFTASSPVLGTGEVRTGTTAAAVAASAIALVFGGAWLILNLGTARRGGAAPTALHRLLVHAAVALVVAYAVLEHFGFDVRALLTTSAVTAAIGLAMQPTLDSMISGVELSSDRTLRVGDGIVRDGEAMQVEAMTWRNVVVRRSDGAAVMLPNAKLSDGELEILPRDRSVRSEVAIKLPCAVPPQLVVGLASELIADSLLVDRARSVSAAPLEWEASSASTRYRIRYWVAHYQDLVGAEADVYRRLWYGFQRHRIALAGTRPPPRFPTARQRRSRR